MSVRPPRMAVDSERDALLACPARFRTGMPVSVVHGGSSLPLGLRSRFVRFGALVVLLASLGAFAPGFAGAQSAPADSVPALAPPRGLVYADVPGDAGLAVELSWTLSPDDSVGTGLVTGYFLERSTAPGGPWTVVDSVVARTASYTDQSIRRDTPYFYRVGVFGPRGTGLVAERKLQSAVNLSMCTLSKALGGYGGAVACSAPMKEWLVNKARALIYTTAPPPASVVAAPGALDVV